LVEKNKNNNRVPHDSLRVLIVKTSSMGDVIHTFPALSDAARAIPGIRFDWVVEESFSEIPAWHPAVEQVIPSAMRRWRKSWFGAWRSGALKAFADQLNEQHYDAVIDAQGLIKSALITRKVNAVKHGLDKRSAREPLASRFYDHRHHVDRQQHAIERTRQLFARALDYKLDDLPLQYGLSVQPDELINEQTLMFLTGTTWSSKRWPLRFWSGLAQQAVDAGYRVLLPAGNDEEVQQASELAARHDAIEVLADKTLSQMAAIIKAVKAVVSVDTGLAHLAAALDVPTIALYGPTDARLTGILGNRQQSLQAEIDCSPCLQRVCPRVDADQPPPCTDTLDTGKVWNKLQAVL
jgi:heptosyltransferase-1